MTNLLIDQWIPVRTGNQLQKINLETLLTTDSTYQLALPRDDMELSALQLLISIVQSLAPPKDVAELRQRADQPVDKQHVHQWTSPFIEAFDLLHTSQPFMQVIDPKAKETTPIQKLFIGLPEGNNHAFFNQPGELEQVCGGCAAIALFNLASNAPGFSGKHKAGLRGGGKINTLALGGNLRETLWLNVLAQPAIEHLLPNAKDQAFCWQQPITGGSKIHASCIGLNRGLFWQPLRLKLDCREYKGHCQHCGHPADRFFYGFWCEADFKFEVVGQWPHPHSPRQWDFKKGSRERERYLSFNQMVPGWTQLNHFILNRQTDSEGSVKAQVIQQFEEVFQDRNGRTLHLLVAAYTNKQAAILERRHDLYSMPVDFQQQKPLLEQSVDAALSVKSTLRGQLYYFGKQTGANIHTLAERQFYQQTETLLHQLLQGFSFKQGKAVKKAFIGNIKSLARSLFDQFTQPYRHQPSGMQFYAVTRQRFESGLYRIKE